MGYIVKYDKIIIGAGSAGAIIASRLTEDERCSVLLLEAGPDYPTLDKTPDPVKYAYGHDPNIWGMAFGHGTKFGWNYYGRTTDKSPPKLFPRGKLVGGSSAINAQIFLRGIPEDYDNWAELGNDRWSFEQLLPYFRMIERDIDIQDQYHGTSGPIITRRFKKDEWNNDQRAFYESCLLNGYDECLDHNNPYSTGIGAMPVNHFEGIRYSTALGYLSLARNRDNLTISSESLVHKVLIDAKRAKGVLFEKDNELIRAEADEIILCGGAIASPHLLMLSGIGNPNNINQYGIPVIHELPGVGQNLRDHPQVSVIWKLKPEERVDPLSSPLQIGLRYTASGSSLRNDMCTFGFSALSIEGTYHISHSPRDYFSLISQLYLEISSGQVYLGSSDPHVQPVIDANYFQDPFDIQRMRESIYISLSLGDQSPLKSLIQERVLPTNDHLLSSNSLDDWIRSEAATSHHLSSTCKMGIESDQTSVVDQFGKVYGIDSLRVADASIMPDCIRANTNVTTMVIGERIADFIRTGY